MEKKKGTTKSNKKGTNVSTRKSTSTTKKVEKKEVKTPVATKKVEKEIVKPVLKKEEVKKNTPVEPNDEFAGNEIRKLLIIIGAVCAVMLSFYFITEFVVKHKKEENTENNKTTTPEIQYDEILMGEMFNQGSGEYYIFAYDEKDSLLSTYESYIKQYEAIDGHKKFYRVNLSNDFNKGYVGTEAYIEGDDVTKIKVTGTTLIKIIDNKVSYSYLTFEKIVDKIQRLIG